MNEKPESTETIPIVDWEFHFFRALVTREDCLRTIEMCQATNGKVEQVIKFVKERMTELSEA